MYNVHVCTGASVCVYVLRIVSPDKILYYKNTLIIVITIYTLSMVSVGSRSSSSSSSSSSSMSSICSLFILFFESRAITILICTLHIASNGGRVATITAKCFSPYSVHSNELL